MSTATKLTTVEINDKTGIATLTMNRPPVNSQNVQLLLDLQTSISEIENNKSRGLILTSVSSVLYITMQITLKLRIGQLQCVLSWPGHL